MTLIIFQMYESFTGKGDKLSFKSMLSLYHDLGMVLYWSEQSINDKLLESTVILETQSFATLVAQLASPFHFAKQKSLSLGSASVELNGWLSASTMKKFCDSQKWDSRIISIVMGALKLMCTIKKKGFITYNLIIKVVTFFQIPTRTGSTLSRL